jgi:ribonuclease D
MNETSLHELATAARVSGRIALDTEFMGEGRYRTLLCLVQLAVGGSSTDIPAQRIELVDPLAEDLDATPLAAVLADPKVQVVVHAGRQDVALIRRRFDTDVANVFDTQVAAGFAGLGAQSSYESLSAEQREYAREDVVHLLELAAELERRLDTSGRLQWAREECEPLARSSDERDLERIFARLPRIRGMSPSSRPVARELVEWRERTASRHDRPVQSVLSDAALVEIAKRKPASKRELEQIRGVGAGGQRRAEDLLEAVRSGRERPLDHAPAEERGAAPRPDDAPLVALAEALIRARAREAGLAYELLAARADLQAIVAAHREGKDEADVRTLRGWRRELVGAELLELLDGRLSLSVRSGKISVKPEP